MSPYLEPVTRGVDKLIHSKQTCIPVSDPGNLKQLVEKYVCFLWEKLFVFAEDKIIHSVFSGSIF